MKAAHEASGRLSGKVALVVGAGSSGPGWGNGKATAVLFAREGAHVVAVDRDAAAVAETVALIEREGFPALAVVADVTRPESGEEMVAAATEAHGQLDILHNNVGILRRGGVVDQSPDDWHAVIDTNLTGTYLTCKAAVPAMLSSGGGSIVNVSSAAGIRYLGVPYASYAASKAGLLQLTATTAVEYAARGIRVNAVVPGLIDTPMAAGSLRGAYGDDEEELRRIRNDQVPMGRMGEAWDVAHAALFLASDDAKYVTGTQLVVDGGLTAKC
jgi:NAD(P)-dependent dehydrogenase (short-subunit alcohol dehydrogenase family)